jgi:tRNA threonylcarbamoyladenosine biosynthesis protein TsaB
MRILAVDTSSERGSVCIHEDGEIQGEVRLRRSVQHSDRLFRSVDFLLRYVAFGLADIDLFVAARGPGSFTGLRVGLAAMEAFAAAHGKPGAGVSTLEALAWRCGVREQWIAPVIDARRGEVYGAIYRRESSGMLIEVQAPSVMPPEEWFASLPDEEIVFCGDGVLRYPQYISRPNWTAAEVDLYLATALAELAVLPNRGPLSPLYVRRTEAEIKRERRHESVTSSNPKSQTF